MPHPEQSNYQTSGKYSAADLTSLVELQTEAESLYTKKELQTALSKYYKTRDVTPCGDVPPFFPVWYMAVDQEQDEFADELYQRMTMSKGYRYIEDPGHEPAAVSAISNPPSAQTNRSSVAFPT